MDAKNRWRVSELLAKDCEKAWTHTGWEDTMHKRFEWLEHMKKKDEKGKWRRCISERWTRLLRVQKEVLEFSTKPRSQQFGGEEYTS